MSCRPALVGSLLVGLSSLASGQTGPIVPVSQSRYVLGEVVTCSYEDGEYHQAPGFGPWSAVADFDSAGTYVTGFAYASQSSTITPNGISGSGFTEAFADDFCGSYGYTAASGISHVHVEFDLTEKVVYRLHGGYGAPSQYHYDWGSGYARLAGPGGDIVNSGDEELDVSGVLLPGRYSVTFQGASTPSASSYDYHYLYIGYGYTFEVSPLTETYCTAAPNSTGTGGASIASAGSLDIAANDFELQASGLPPGVPGLFFYGPNPIQVPFGDGFRCVGGNTSRLQPPVAASAQGLSTFAVDFTVPPAGGGGSGAITPLSTWRFQLWYRDPTGPGGSGFNLTDALRATFCP